MTAQIDLPIKGEFLDRILKLQERRRGGQNTKVLGPEIAYEALNIGLNTLEATLDELEAHRGKSIGTNPAVPEIFETAAAARKA